MKVEEVLEIGEDGKINGDEGSTHVLEGKLKPMSMSTETDFSSHLQFSSQFISSYTFPYTLSELKCALSDLCQITSAWYPVVVIASLLLLLAGITR